MVRLLDCGRRGVIRGAAALVASPLFAEERVGEETPRYGPSRLKQAVARWCFSAMSLDQLARHALRIGYQGIDLLGPDEWPVVRKHGLVCPMAMVGGVVRIEQGFNRVENHPELVAALGRAIELAADAGVPNIVCFSGNRAGISDEEGLANCARGLAQLVPLAEKKGVTLCMELLNSKLDHKDYMCDRTSWGAALARKVGSPRFKLLYDVYHMQIMEGDVIRTIRENIQWIAHFHAGGNPGRHEIDETQELNYRGICRAIAETGYEGFIAQEFVPKGDPVRAMEQAFRICRI